MKVNQVEFIVNLAFREVTNKVCLDIIKGNQLFEEISDYKMKDIPDYLVNYVNKYNYGCSFVFSAYMISILNDYGIRSYMIGTKEGAGIRASVLYEKDGEYYVANPVEDIKYFTENNITSDYRKYFYLEDTAKMLRNSKFHDDSCYTLEEFPRKYGDVWFIGSMTCNDDEIFGEEVKKCKQRCIAPPEHRNYEI